MGLNTALLLGRKARAAYTFIIGSELMGCRKDSGSCALIAILLFIIWASVHINGGKMRRLYVICDMQFGSCGKGLLAGYLAKRIRPDTIVTAWAPNAGHTFIDADGTKFVNIALPNGIISPRLKQVLIGPGSVIDLRQLSYEMGLYNNYVQPDQIFIHEHAAVVDERHRAAEAQYGFIIGSTMKGVGEATCEKVRRKSAAIVAYEALRGTALQGNLVSVNEYNDRLDAADTVLLEGAQGFSLSINQGFYPYVTSRECTVHQLLSDCAIPHPSADGHIRVYGVCRTFPIRVANRYDADGRQIGTSGPCYDDQREMKWEELGVEPELTTVTKLPRRVFSFSKEQIQQAVRMNGIDDVFLNFVNYLRTRSEVEALVQMIQSTGARVGWLGTGPSESSISEQYTHRW